MDNLKLKIKKHQKVLENYIRDLAKQYNDSFKYQYNNR